MSSWEGSQTMRLGHCDDLRGPSSVMLTSSEGQHLADDQTQVQYSNEKSNIVPNCKGAIQLNYNTWRHNSMGHFHLNLLYFLVNKAISVLQIFFPTRGHALESE